MRTGLTEDHANDAFLPHAAEVHLGMSAVIKTSMPGN